MDKQTKHKVREEVAESFKKSNCIIVMENNGLTVQEMTDLRVELRKNDAEFHVVKNRLVKKAIENDINEYQSLADHFKGPVGLVYGFGDAVQAAKTVIEFQKKNSKKVGITAGYIDNSSVTPDELKAIADLPSKEELLAKIVGSIVAPHRGLVCVLNGVSQKLVQVINAIKDKKTA